MWQKVKTKSKKVLRANSYVCRGYKGKPGMGGFLAPSSPLLNRVNDTAISTSFVLPVSEVHELNLNNSESIMLSFESSL